MVVFKMKFGMQNLFLKVQLFCVECSGKINIKKPADFKMPAGLNFFLIVS